jgi:hypothetical protein
VWHPIDLPEGYHPVPRGQAWQARPTVGEDVAPGAPGGRAAPGRRDATQSRHARSVIVAERPVEKHLTKNQVLGGRTANRSEPANEECPRLHQLVHQRLRTTMDILGPELNDEARPRTNCR